MTVFQVLWSKEKKYFERDVTKYFETVRENTI
jgi:hypothetical protein